MANRRSLQALTRQVSAFICTNPSLQSLTHLPPLPNTPITSLTSNLLNNLTDSTPSKCSQWPLLRYFSSSKENNDANEGNDIKSDDDHDEEYEEEGDWESSDDEDVSVSSGKRKYNPEEKEAEAAAIGYKVIGPLDKKDGVFKPYERLFAVVQIGSHQFKVSNGDCIFTERLKFCEVNDKALDAKVIIFKKKRRKNYR